MSLTALPKEKTGKKGTRKKQTTRHVKDLSRITKKRIRYKLKHTDHSEKKEPTNRHLLSWVDSRGSSSSIFSEQQSTEGLMLVTDVLTCC